MHPVDRVLAGLPAQHRSLAPGEWGVTFEDVGGAALHVGLREHDGLLRVQAEACPAAWAPEAHWLLHRNRLGELARRTHTSAGDVWVQCDVPAAGLSAQTVERVLAAVVLAVEEVRYAARRRATSR